MTAAIVPLPPAYSATWAHPPGLPATVCPVLKATILAALRTQTLPKYTFRSERTAVPSPPIKSILQSSRLMCARYEPASQMVSQMIPGPDISQPTSVSGPELSL
ncbi:MAG: hypothetical protein BWZ10_03140 [candidate division BRC1 bacterium ADurb.BinA364]|nr:MAG: hypothetical protein BWZ10_03140 [candidate division BRC1 bacterium ADurb.BinA364]